MTNGTSTTTPALANLRVALEYAEAHGLPIGSIALWPKRVTIAGDLADVLAWAAALGVAAPVVYTTGRQQHRGKPGVQASFESITSRRTLPGGVGIGVVGSSPCDITGEHEHDECPARVLAEYQIGVAVGSTR